MARCPVLLGKMERKLPSLVAHNTQACPGRDHGGQQYKPLADRVVEEPGKCENETLRVRSRNGIQLWAVLHGVGQSPNGIVAQAAVAQPGHKTRCNGGPADTYPIARSVLFTRSAVQMASQPIVPAAFPSRL
jgi:hypothetical protein